MRVFYRFILALLVLFSCQVAHAEDNPPERVSVLTMGPGDHAFARFGHNAILLEWPSEQRALVFNFGTFAFGGLEGVRDFMAGRFRYWLSVSSLARTQRFYASHNRSLVAQELELDLEERRTLALALAENALPEHRFYDYDYYYDNCSTRVRDALDRVLGGELRRKIQEPGRYTFREHTERLTADAFWLYFGLDLALGPRTDRPIRRWDELFVPGELHDALAGVRRTRGGRDVPLVRSERQLLEAQRDPPRTEPPSRAPLFGAVGLLLGAVMALLGQLGARRPIARAAFGGVLGLLGLLLGLLGCVFVFFWAFTKHWSAYQNENILVCPPWALPLLIGGFAFASGKGPWLSRAHGVLGICVVSSLVALVLAAIPSFGQDNTRVALLLAPVWIGLYVGASATLGRPLVPRRKPYPGVKPAGPPTGKSSINQA